MDTAYNFDSHNYHQQDIAKTELIASIEHFPKCRDRPCEVQLRDFAAANAGMDCFVLTTMHHKDEFAQPNIIGFAPYFKNFNL